MPAEADRIAARFRSLDRVVAELVRSSTRPASPEHGWLAPRGMANTRYVQFGRVMRFWLIPQEPGQAARVVLTRRSFLAETRKRHKRTRRKQQARRQAIRGLTQTSLAAEWNGSGGERVRPRQGHAGRHWRQAGQDIAIATQAAQCPRHARKPPRFIRG
ncbi:MAG: hypothetical protein GWP08_19815 [Nitrospiraceae bacterium]|nr:hypothetical protein [Nitrospiraceae bacterium]